MRHIPGLVVLAVAAVLALSLPALANGSEGGAPSQRPTAENATQIIASKLKELRMDPSRRTQFLQIFREKAVRFGGSDQLDMRMGEIDGLIDQALRMGDGEFGQNREQVARRIWYYLSGE